MTWKKVALEEIAEIKGGKRLPSGHDFSTVQTSHLYIRARDIGDGKIIINDPVYISEQTANVLRNYTVNENDIVITIVGANIGDIGFITNGFDGANLTENAAKVRVSTQVCNPKFLQLQLATATTKYRFQSIIGGAAQGKLGLFKIKSFEVILPPLSTQNKIADILSAYDDLIENNRRRIDLLEQSARMLYKEWFVSLRFPGHEHVKVKDGVPQGWEKKRLADWAILVMGQSPASEHYNTDGDGLPFHQGVTNFGGRIVKHETYCKVEGRIAEAGDILCSVRAPVGWLNITLDRIVIGRGLSAIRSINGYQSFLYYQLKNHFFKEDMIGGGAIFASVTKKDMENQLLLCPPNQLIEDFEQNTKPIDEQLKTLHLQNQKLQQARDLLLPRLMNGEIPV